MPGEISGSVRPGGTRARQVCAADKRQQGKPPPKTARSVDGPPGAAKPAGSTVEKTGRKNHHIPADNGAALPQHRRVRGDFWTWSVNPS